MGEMADMYNDSMMDADFDPFGDEPDVPLIDCKYCGKHGLHWEETSCGWRLFEADGSLHQCNDPFTIVKKISCPVARAK